jgi:hypothetical protein
VLQRAQEEDDRDGKREEEVEEANLLGRAQVPQARHEAILIRNENDGPCIEGPLPLTQSLSVLCVLLCCMSGAVGLDDRDLAPSDS